MLGRYGQANSRRYCEPPRPSRSPLPHSSPPASPRNDLRCPHAIRSTLPGPGQWSRRPLQASWGQVYRTAHARRSGTGSPGCPAPLAKRPSNGVADLSFPNSSARVTGPCSTASIGSGSGLLYPGHRGSSRTPATYLLSLDLGPASLNFGSSTRARHGLQQVLPHRTNPAPARHYPGSATPPVAETTRRCDGCGGERVGRPALSW